jgi:pimeloyl-ACP methyl ester carboxylesterase
VESALAVVEASGAPQVVPVAMSHAGWVAIELRRRLKERISKLVLLDWLVLEAPAPFLDALRGMQSPERWRDTVDQICMVWLHGMTNSELVRYVRGVVCAYGFTMWSRAAREISAAYGKAGSPLLALASLKPPVPVLHLYAQPGDAGYLAAQHAFAAEHPWFHVRKLAARSHFPMFEVPDEMASAIGEFAG